MGKIRIQLVTGDLAKEKADVLVNTVGTEGNLVAGSVSYAILEAGGKSLQEDINKQHPYGLKVGDVTQTNGGNLPCKKVFHVVLQQWMNENDKGEELLYRVVTGCLQLAAKQNFTSIAFPALGAGFHRFPGNRSADIMFRAIETFDREREVKFLGVVKIILHQRDILNRKDFEARQAGIDVVHDNYPSKTVVVNTGTASHQDLKVNVIIGCLSQLQADVLVNTTQTDLNLGVGAVSRTLLKKGGQILQTECRKQFPSGLSHGGMVQTQGGKLKCRKVFHVVVPMWNNGKGGSEQGFLDLAVRCLQEANRHNFTSVGFPVLGTGYLAYPVKTSASLMLKAITNFAKGNPSRSVKTVSIVVAHKDSYVRQVLERHVEGEGRPTGAGAGAVQSEGSFLVAGEGKALTGNKVKYFSLVQGSFSSKSAEEYHYQTVSSHFFENLKKDSVNRHIYEITKIHKVVNPRLISNFTSAQARMTSKNAAFGEPVLAYHGTPKENVRTICEDGFRLPNHPEFKEETDVGWYGNGIYFSPYPRFAMNYMQKSQRLLLCKVLQGKVYKCKKLKLGEPKEQGYDSHVDPFGKELVIYDEDCILPCYIVYFNIVKRFKLPGDKYDPHENDDHEIQYLTEMEMHKGEQVPPLV